jgi:hypothetical protein
LTYGNRALHPIDSRTASGSGSITRSSTRAGPSSTRRPCYQLRDVPGEIPNQAANSVWLRPSRRPVTAMSAGQTALISVRRPTQLAGATSRNGE